MLAVCPRQVSSVDIRPLSVGRALARGLVAGDYAFGNRMVVLPKTSHKKVVGIFMLFIFPVIPSFTDRRLGFEVGGNLPVGRVDVDSRYRHCRQCCLPAFGYCVGFGATGRKPAGVALYVHYFIEFWRAVPLITVLFMSSVMLPLFLPEGVNFDNLLRALVGVTLFTAAYLAEVVRGGLAAIPKGQYEAAEAMGLSYWGKMRLIILPQALKSAFRVWLIPLSLC